MGLNFRKSKKIAPGVKFNVGKKSAGISIGGKGGGLSFNSKTGARARVSIPGTGISYTTSLNGKKKRKKKSTKAVKTTSIMQDTAVSPPLTKEELYRETAIKNNLSVKSAKIWQTIFMILAIILLLFGTATLSFGIGAAFIILGCFTLYMSIHYKNVGEYIAKNPDFKTQSPNADSEEYISSLYEDMNNDLLAYENKTTCSSTYFKGLEEIESMWSVLHNLKTFEGDQADIFEMKCKQNISDLHAMLKANANYGFDSSVPPRVPAYVRLSMLYEKQGRYEEAIKICVEAIKAGATTDGNKGKMYGRLARLIRKSGLTVDEETLQLSMKSE